MVTLPLSVMKALPSGGWAWLVTMLYPAALGGEGQVVVDVQPVVGVGARLDGDGVPGFGRRRRRRRSWRRSGFVRPRGWPLGSLLWGSGRRCRMSKLSDPPVAGLAMGLKQRFDLDVLIETGTYEGGFDLVGGGTVFEGLYHRGQLGLSGPGPRTLRQLFQRGVPFGGYAVLFAVRGLDPDGAVHVLVGRARRAGDVRIGG